jgi:quercetin dioxygenase-like cupin family protein
MSREKWIEPKDGKRTGFGKFKKLPLPYDNFMESEGIPIFRDIGVRDIRDLPLKPWKRIGGKGTYIQLYGTEGKWGCYAVEVPAAGELNPEKHMFEKIYLVIEGRGSTEVWLEGDENRKHVFEWGPGSIFSIPLNAWHRIVNATNDPALLQAGTTGPVVVNALQNVDAVFNNPYLFKERFSTAEDFYKENNEVEADPVRGLAMRKTNFVADAVNCHLPLDNRRSPGWRRIEPHMTNNSFYYWIGQHKGGHYSTAHAHTSAAILFCLKGKGYTYTWPEHIGVNPWRDGKEEFVRRMDYVPGGMITAAPGGARWFHQHFSGSSEPLRLTAWFGPHNPGRDPGYPGQPHTDYTAMSIPEGGTSIPYWMEDPHIRQEYEATLEAEGVKSEMDPELYVTPEEHKNFVYRGI